MNLNFLEPCVPVQACNGTALPLNAGTYNVLFINFMGSHFVVHFFIISACCSCVVCGKFNIMLCLTKYIFYFILISVLHTLHDQLILPSSRQFPSAPYCPADAALVTALRLTLPTAPISLSVTNFLSYLRSTVIPRLTKIIRSEITFVSRNAISRWFL